MDDDNYKWITIVLVIWAVVVSFVLSIHNIAVSESNRNLSTLESRIARQDSLLQHHIDEAAFDSTNQVQAFKKIGK